MCLLQYEHDRAYFCVSKVLNELLCPSSLPVGVIRIRCVPVPTPMAHILLIVSCLDRILCPSCPNVRPKKGGPFARWPDAAEECLARGSAGWWSFCPSVLLLAVPRCAPRLHRPQSRGIPGRGFMRCTRRIQRGEEERCARVQTQGERGEGPIRPACATLAHRGSGCGVPLCRPPLPRCIPPPCAT